jgi:RNA polymerase sigma factor (sigma-70 family)
MALRREALPGRLCAGSPCHGQASTRRETGSDMAIERRDGFEGEFGAVLTAARTGAAWALERIYVALSPAVAGLFRAQGVDDPDDLTSEVFVGVLRGLAWFDGDGQSFRSWVFTIAYRRLADERRRAARRPAPVPLAERPEPTAADDVHAEVERSLATDRVRALCDRLAPAQRDVLLLRVFGDLTVDQVAGVIGKSRGAVKALQRRGYAAIALLLEQEAVPL